MKFKFTPETGVHSVAFVSQIWRFVDICWASGGVVILWKDPSWFFHWAGPFLLFVSFFNHATRWSGWKERDSYTRSRRK